MRNKQKEREYFREYERRRYEEVFKPAYDDFIKLYPFTLDDLPGEVWVTIPEFEDYHESNFGRTKRFYKNGNVKILTPCLNKQGYLRVHFSKDGELKNFFVARLVATCFIPNPNNKPFVNHIDGVKFNNHVANLEWVTPAENSQHAFASGLANSAQGCDDYNAVIKNKADIIYIRDNPYNLTGEELAKMFNCTPTTIRRIQLGKTYQNCGGAIRESKHHCLTPEQRELVRRLYKKGAKGFGVPALAKMFNCSQKQIWNIINS